MISRRRVFGMSAAAAAAVALNVPSRARAASDQQDLLDSARASIEQAKHDPQFGNAPDLFRRARAIFVVPQLVKGGFFFGGEGGNGVLMARRNGSWGDPAFYVLGSASFGLQIGLEVAELVMFIQSERALQAFMSQEFKIGAEAGITVLVIGSNAQAATTANANVDIIAWAKAKGAYAGITLEGSLIKPRGEWNEAYYGRPITPQQIINGGAGRSRGAESLRTSLSSR